MTSRRKFQLSALAGALLCICYWLSPYWAVAGMALAAIENRPKDLGTFLDIPSLKADIKSKVIRSTTTTDHQVASVGNFVAAGAIDMLVTPELVGKMFAQALAPYASETRLQIAYGLFRNQTIDWISPVRVSLGPAGSMRRGLITWKLDRFGNQ